MTQRLIYLTHYGDRMRVFGDVLGYSNGCVWVQTWKDDLEGYDMARVEIEVSA